MADPDYPFTSRTMQLSAGRMHYVDEGAGSVVLLAHGTPTWSFEWRHVIRALAPDYRVVAPDHLGFGLSDRPRGAPYTPEWHARNFAEFVDRLDPGPLTLVVHDYGGPIALPIALRDRSSVERIVIINSWMWSFEGDAQMQRNGRIAGGALGRFLYRWGNLSLRVLMPSAYGNRKALTPAIHQRYLKRFADRQSRGEVLWPLARAIIASSAFYESLWQERVRLQSLPALIIWGMKDSAFKPHQLQKWRTALPAAQIVELADVGHWPHEEDPEAVIAGLRSFLGRRAAHGER